MEYTWTVDVAAVLSLLALLVLGVWRRFRGAASEPLVWYCDRVVVGMLVSALVIFGIGLWHGSSHDLSSGYRLVFFMANVNTAGKELARLGVLSLGGLLLSMLLRGGPPTRN
jgi:hypothetical protein